MKIKILLLLCLASATAFSDTTKNDKSRLSVTASAAYFYDGNVTESVVYNGTVLDNSSAAAQPKSSSGGSSLGPGTTGGGAKGWNPLPGNPIAAKSALLLSGPSASSGGASSGPGSGQGQIAGYSYTAPTGNIYADSGAKTNLDLGYKLYDTDDNSFEMVGAVDATFYQQYFGYDYQAYSGGFRYTHYGDAVDFTTLLTYISTDYNGFYNQDYLHLEPAWEWKNLWPVVDWSFSLNKFMQTYINSYNISTTVMATWEKKKDTYRFGVTPIYGSGDSAMYNSSLGITSGLEFSRYFAYSVFAEHERDWNRTWSSLLRLAYTQTNYVAENLPSSLPAGIQSGARADGNFAISATSKYHIKN